MGETRVDLLHLLEDLRDAYPGGIEETILTEIVANSLDSGATLIALACDPAAACFTVTDDGGGMARRELARFHDLAATTKTRGHGIGFAGVGIKLGLLACEDVLTETRRGKSHVASSWRLTSRHRAAWQWVPPPGLVAAHGTAVRLRLHEPLSPLLDSGFVTATLQRHFQPLLEPAFDPVLARHYRGAVCFSVNGIALPRADADGDPAPLRVRVGHRRTPSATGYLTREPAPLPRDRRGVAISTLGKVILRGWDWLGLTPAAADRIGGIVEVPALAECLQLNKADFIRSGPRGQIWLAHRKALQQAVSAQLADWGDVKESEEASRRRKTRPLERDLEAVLLDLADDFPLVAALVERRAGGQRKLPMGGNGGPGAPPGTAGGAPIALPGMGGERDSPAPAGAAAPHPAPGTEPEGPQPVEVPQIPPPADARGPRRPAHYGLAVQFENRPDDPELGRLVESTVWVNEAHPAYRRAAAARAEGYHVAVTVAMALARLVVEPGGAHGFITAFLAKWGARLDSGAGQRRGSR
ncbi:MAG TPA: ATP-binding protein [Gemmatimonadales bacterium]|jgi:hypothetical protein